MGKTYAETDAATEVIDPLAPLHSLSSPAPTSFGMLTLGFSYSAASEVSVAVSGGSGTWQPVIQQRPG